MTYRSDIDGLRALAVGAVVLYHLGLGGLSGGFVGVDIFFVISGYLITRIVFDEMRSGTFSFVSFYERRVRRILPALLVAIFAGYVLSHLISFPADYRTYGASAVAALLSASNVLFWLKTDYFSSDADFQMLLHTWSLGVEEQFYLLLPPALLLAFRWRCVKSALVCAWLLSLAVSVATTPAHPQAAFYLLHTRAWELLTGSLLAVSFLPPVRHQLAREIIAAAGLAAILVSVFSYTSQTTFPGAAALLPCLGAAAIIHAGAGGATRVSRLLSQPLPAFLGQISYSLYLWHWIVLISVRQYLADVNIGLGAELCCLVASLAAATASWRFVERPFRHRSRVPARAVFAGSGLGAALLATLGLVVYKSNGLTGRFPEAMQPVFTSFRAALDVRDPCDARFPADGLCRLGAEGAKPHVLLWGDSHAAALFTALGTYEAGFGGAVALAAFNACAPLVGLQTHHATPARCALFNRAVLDWVKDPANGIDTVVVAGYWPMYVAALGGAGRRGMFVSPSAGDLTKSADEVYEDLLTATFAALRALRKNIVFVDSAPEFRRDVPRLIFAAWRHGVAVEVKQLPAVRKEFAAINAAAGRAARRFSVSILDPAPMLCHPLCAERIGESPAFIDNNHLSLDASRYLASAMRGSIGRSLAEWRTPQTLDAAPPKDAEISAVQRPAARW